MSRVGTTKAYRDNFKLIKWVERPKPSANTVGSEPSVLGTNYAVAPYYVPDIKEFVSPMSGRVLSSRRQVQHEERGYGVRQCGELKNLSDFDNTARSRERTNDRVIEKAFRKTLEQNPNIKWND